MENPVITPYGHSFERKAIVEVINRNGKCPITRKKLGIKDLIPNYSLKTAIENYKKTTKKKEI
jgi:STIP1 family protein 1